MKTQNQQELNITKILQGTPTNLFIVIGVVELNITKILQGTPTHTIFYIKTQS